MQRTGLPPATKDMEAAPHIWCMGTCVIERIRKERVGIIDVPEWDHCVMGMMTAAVTIEYLLHHIECAKTVPAKTSIY